MIRTLNFCLTLLALFLTTFCMAQKSELKFNKDGKFKIVQFTDVHFKYGNPASDVALERINQVLDAEQPDVVIFTGDVIYSAPADSGMLKVLEQVSKRKLPFVVTFGNHDDEQGLTRTQLYDIIRTVPGNLMPDRGTALSPDYVLTVKSSSDPKKDAALLYCIDSHSYSPLKDVKGYNWLTFDQINWYRQQSAAYKAQNGGQPVPALAFFHIPLPEYHEAVRDENAALRGTRMEEACSPRINTGMFAAMKEAGDVMGVFVGHDHDNDYAVMWKNILLAYGRYTGGNTVYNHLPNGARIIVLDEGARTFTSWIRQKAYHSIHLDIMQRKSREKRSSSRYLGELGEKLTDLKLKVTRVRLEDDPYKTRVNGTTPQFFVKQILTLTDASGNLAVMSIPSKNPSAVSCTLSGIEHEYRLGEIIYIESAKVSRRYESYGSKYTRLSHVKFTNLNV